MKSDSKIILSSVFNNTSIDDGCDSDFSRLAVQPSDSICCDFRAALHNSGDGYDDDDKTTNSDAFSSGNECREVEMLYDSPFIKMPSQNQAVSVLTLQQRIEWDNLVESVRIGSQQKDRHEEYEIILGQGVFKGTLIKIFYDRRWFVVDIKTTPVIEKVISDRVGNLIDRLFSCSVNWVRVFLRHHSQSRSQGKFWTGANGVIQCHVKKVRNC